MFERTIWITSTSFLQSILEQICKEKALVTKVFTKITDIINNGDPGYENKPNYTVCASTIVLGTMLATHDPVIIPLIRKFFPQLLSTLLLSSTLNSFVVAIF